MNTYPHITPKEIDAVVREAQAMRAAYIRDTVARFGHWLARSFHLARPAH